MEKRSVILLMAACIILAASPVSAEISLQGPGKTEVNIGDELLMSGYLLRSHNTIGTFRLVLSCAVEQQLLAKSLSLQANVQKPFSETVIIPSYLDSPCVVKAAFESSGAVLEQASSPIFAISRNLVGVFTLDKQEIKRGDILTLTAFITKLDGTPMEGGATLRFKQGSTDVSVFSTRVSQGRFSYVYDSRENPSGSYAVEVTPQDGYGNAKTFMVGTFTITGDVLLFAEPDKLHYSPGEKVKVAGEATILGKPLKKAKLFLSLGENTAEDDVSSGTFTKSIQIPFTIKSGTQKIGLSVEDSFGNRGQMDLSIIVDPKPAEIGFSKEKEAHLPGETVKIVPVIIDQAGDVIHVEIGLIISNPKGKEIFADSIMSNTEYEFHLAGDALPGAWKVRLSSSGIEKEGTLLVGEKVVLDYVLQNQSLVITNKGNIRFNGPLKVEYRSLEKKFTLVKEFSLASGESFSLDLFKDVEPGVYDIYVADKVFEKVVVTESSWSSEDTLVLMLALVALGLLVALIMYIRNWLRQGQKRHRIPPRKFDPGKKILHVSHSLSEAEHVQSFRQKMAVSSDDKRSRLRMRFKKGKELDEYIYELPKKKERMQERSPSQDYPSWNLERAKEPEGWKEPDYTSYWHDQSSYVREQESSYRKERESPKREKKPDDDKGLFNMFG